jgi:DivIVA domain-containing protein
MIDLTPLDVRNKRGDFKKLLRGYDPQEVDTFLEMVSDRLEDVVRENMQLRDRVNSLQQMVDSQTGRERAVQEALVTAQELRADIKGAAQREAELVIAEAKSEARSLLAEADAELRNRLRDAERRLEAGRDTMEEIERRRTRFLKNFRQLLERELEDVGVEERKEPVDQRPIELDLGRPKGLTPDAGPQDAPEATAGPGADPADETAFPPLDVAVDDLADGYRAEVESLFDLDGTDVEQIDDGDRDETDLFSFPKDDPEEDTRWG